MNTDSAIMLRRNFKHTAWSAGIAVVGYVWARTRFNKRA
jgi:hypothetical protein